MAVGKQQKKKGGKGKKKIIDPFLRKEWYTIRAPGVFNQRDAGKTLISKTQGTKIASEEMLGRVFEVSLADLNKDEDQSHRKIKLVAEDVRGFDVLTGFHGMDTTRDKLCSLIKKWHTLVEAFVDAKTSDGYTVRLFCIGFTRRRPNQVCKTSYAQAAQCRAIRAKMVQIMAEETGKGELKDLFNRLIAGVIGREIERACHGIYPLQNVLVRKVKVLKRPKFDLAKLMELHADTTPEDAGAAVARDDTMVETVAGSGGRL